MTLLSGKLSHIELFHKSDIKESCISCKILRVFNSYTKGLDMFVELYIKALYYIHI